MRVHPKDAIFFSFVAIAVIQGGAGHNWIPAAGIALFLLVVG